MSKSKGNVITLLDVKKKYGSDIFRFYLTSANNVDATFDWVDADADATKKNLDKLYFIMGEVANNKKEGDANLEYVSKFYKILKKANNFIEKMEIRDYNIQAVFEMMALVTKAKKDLKGDDLSYFFNFIFEDWVKLISPVVPHLAEELWEKSGGDGFVSLANWPEVDSSKISEESSQMDLNEKIILEVKEIVDKTEKSPSVVYLYVIPFEIDKIDSSKISEELDIEVKVFAVNDPEKYDPERKAKKAKPGRVGIFIE